VRGHYGQTLLARKLALGPISAPARSGHSARALIEAELEDLVECVALILIAVGVLATALYAEKIYKLLRNKEN